MKIIKCEYCGKELNDKQIKNKNRFCGNSCSAKWRVSKIGLPKMTDEQKKELAEKNRIEMRKRWMNKEFRENNHNRMTKDNPMWKDDIKEKAVETRKLNCSYTNNFNFCGNGFISKVEQIAGNILIPLGFEFNKIFGTKTFRDLYPERNYAKNYKPDFYKDGIIIEIDGDSHKQQRAIDRKKEEFFKLLGIKTFRFSNDFVENHTKDFEKEVNKICDLYLKEK